LLIISVTVILSAPTALLARHGAVAEPPPSPARRFLAGASWTLCGLILLVSVAFVLDLANVPFIPFR
jgi:hypothetical protein